MKDLERRRRVNCEARPRLLMRIGISTVFLIAALFLAGCGARFGPGYSIYDKGYFADKPHIVVHTNTTTYGLRWQYGEMGFFFEPRSKMVNGELCFSLQGTSSSGALGGLYSEIPITGSNQIKAIQSGGAFWVEPGWQKVRLEERKL